MRRLLALGAASCAVLATTLPLGAAQAAAPAAAPSAPATGGAQAVGLGFSSAEVDVVMTNNGAAHVAYLTRPPAAPPVLNICTVPAGGSACSATVSRPLPNTDYTLGPWIVSDGTKVVAAVGNYNGANERTFATLAPDGATYGALTQVSNITAKDVELSPAGDRLWITSSRGPTSPGSAYEYQAFAAAPLPGAGPAATTAAVFAASPGSRDVDGQLIGTAPDGKPVAFIAGFTPDFPRGSYYRTFGGTVVDASLNSAASWGGLTKYDAAAPAERNGYYDVFSGNGRMWLGYEGLQKETVLRPFANGSFGAPVYPGCTDSRYGASTQEAPDVAISRTGDLLVTEVGSNGNGEILAYFHGTPDGSAFSAPQTLFTGAIGDVETAADPTSDSGGVAVWNPDGNYGGPVSFVRFPAAAPGPCAGPSTVSAKVGKATVSLKVPDSCVGAGKKLKLKATKKGKGTITQVAFKATGAKKVVDKKAPFKATLKVKKNAVSGSLITVKAKITVVPPKGKTLKKTLKTTVAVC